ncbi:DsbC family protein [Ideonella sp. YS5]|uniref:DsbC family protein n=1 Tax=Ideonella sp. YS5 TaxID=3453714 RepID=UPI003EEF88DA
MHAATAQEAEIRKALAARLPPSTVVDEVTPSPIAGLYEVRSGVSVFYTDSHGDYVIRGEMLDTRTRMNLTEARIAKISKVDFSTLPLRDAVVSIRGSGTRKVAVFADPECPFCKELESMLQERDDVTVYTFLMPILGPGSVDKAKAIWCDPDRGAAWGAWMREGKLPVARPDCDTGALDRNLLLRNKLAIRGTPTLVFENGTRTSGALSAVKLERELGLQGPAAKP